MPRSKLVRLLRSYKFMRPHINILSSTSIITPGMPRMPAIRQFRKVMPREKLKKPPIISSTISSRKPRPACSSSLIASFRGADNSFRKRYTPTMITASSSIADRSIKFPFRSALAERVGIYFFIKSRLFAANGTALRCDMYNYIILLNFQIVKLYSLRGSVCLKSSQYVV